LFGSRHGLVFADNSRYVFSYCVRTPPAGIRVAWITHSRVLVSELRRQGFPAYLAWSPKGIALCLTAGVQVFDYYKSDIARGTMGGALEVNLWHGTPLKRIGQDVIDSENQFKLARQSRAVQRLWTRFRNPAPFEEYDSVIATSATAASRFSSGFGLRPEQIAVTGYPRNDVLTDPAATSLLKAEQDLLGTMSGQADSGERIVWYAPTFRDGIPKQSPASRLDLPALNEMLAKHNARMYCKLHFNDDPPGGLHGNSRIEWVLPRTDVYPFLDLTDALVTDYSSIFFDYLLLDKPLVFYPYDLADYAGRARGLYDEYDEVTPGPKARTARELVSLLDALLADYEGQSAAWALRRAAVRSTFHAHQDAGSSERVVRHLLALSRSSSHALGSRRAGKSAS
jgi:CDP-glycerol glycerophosphotransferase (TagB/SpsB family)